MSSIEPDTAAPVGLELPDWDRLEREVERLLDEYTTWRRRALTAEARVADLETLMRSIADGSLDPLAIAHRLERVEAENTALRDRLARARDQVRHIQLRLDFLQEGR